MMSKMAKKRRLKELYNATLEIKEAEITPVLNGNYRMQGPVDQMDNQTKTASSRDDKGVERSNMSQKFEARVNPGTCNMCSAPCSSCFHINKAIIGSKGGESSREMCRENVFDCSVNVGSTFKSRKCETGQHITSEVSNALTMNSSHDSFSENAESKRTLRTIDVSIAPQDVELSSKLFGLSATKNQDNIKLHKVESDRDHLQNKCNDSRDFEGHDDNISCISGADGVTTVSSADSRTIESKRVPTYAASPNSLVSKDCVKAVPSQTIQCLHMLDFEGSKICTRHKCNDITTQEVCPPVSLPADLLHDSGLLENTLPKDIGNGTGSVSVQSINSNTPTGKSGEVNLRSQLCAEMPDCPREYLNPLVTNKVVSNTLCGDESVFCISGDTLDIKLGGVGAKPKPKVEYCVKLEADDGDITAGLATEALRSLEEIHDAEKVRELLVLPNAKETSIQSHHMIGLPTEALNSVEQIHVNDESDIVEHGQVCDTCGDLGREDLLAVCCRCSDGAEHTYCMMKKLDKVPERGWMCQECKIKERENRENDKHDAMGGVTYQLSGRGNSKNSHLCGKSDGKDTFSETNKTDKDSSYVKVSRKRNPNDVADSSAAKEQALEPTVRSSKTYNVDRVGLPCRNSSFKNLDRGNSKPVRQLHSVAYSVSDTKGIESPTLGTRLQKPRGTLSKSNSFSTAYRNPKLKFVDEAVFRKQKSMRKPASPDTKEGPSRVMGRSLSFISLDSDRLSYGESRVKMLSPKFSHVQDKLGFKHAKEQNFAKRKNSFKFEHSVASSTTASSTISSQRVDQEIVSRCEPVSFSITNKCESKAVLTDGKLTQPARPVNHAVRGDHKKQLPCSSSRIGNYAEQMPIHARMKDSVSSNSFTTVRPISKVDGSLHGPPHAQESTNFAQTVKGSSSSCPRQGGTAGTKSVSRQKCGDTELLAPDVLSARNVEVLDECNKLKTKLEAAQPKKIGIYRDDRVLDQYDEISTSSTKCEVSSLNQPLNSSNSRKLVVDKVLNEGLATAWNSNADSTKQTIVTSMKQFSLSADAVNSRIINNIPNLPINGIPNMTDLPSQASVVTSALSTDTAIPENEYIWQGCFEVHRSTNLTDLYDGFQAHLSNCASPRVIQTMNNFPHKVLLNEVPRLSIWPIQFMETGVTEDHIGLYFFARDYESYVKCYKNVVERMMRNDLALKGNIDGVEILIFPSNQLPVKSQCWNMMFFLWGVFRGKGVDFLQQVYGSPMKVPTTRDIPTAIMSFPENILSLVPIDKLPTSHMASDVVSEAHTLADFPHPSSAGTSCETKSFSAFQKGICSNLTVEQPEFKLDYNLLPSIPICPPQSRQGIRSTPVGKTVGNAERLFPVKNVDVGDRSILWNGEELPQERVPNLELALGAEIKPMKKSRQDQALDRAATKAEEDLSDPLSLSLSLSLPR